MSTKQTYEDSELDGFEDRFIYVTELPSLQEIASYKIALETHYSHYGDRSSYIPIRLSCRCIKLKPNKEVISLKIPHLIENQIKNSMEKVAQELSVWAKHFENVLFWGSKGIYLPCHVDINWCVWSVNGEIDYLKTCMKMLTSGKFCERQKFIVLSEYCMENEIKEIPSDALSSSIYSVNSLQYYWICYLKNKLHRIRLRNYASSRHNGTLAREYFWNRLSEDDRGKIITEWRILGSFTNLLECTFLERVISSISWHQQCRLLALKSEALLITLSVYSNSVRCALWVWKKCKDSLSDEQFAQVIYEILKQWEEHCKNKNSLCPALIEIWETAHDHQRNFVSQTETNSIIDMCLFEIDEPSANVLGFLRSLLALMHTKDRKEIIFGKITQIKYYFIGLDVLNEVVNICLPYPDDKLMFMNLVMDSNEIRRHFFNCIRLKKIEKFNMLLPQDVEAARAFKKTFLKSITYKEAQYSYYIWDIDEWNELEKFIGDSFADDESQIVKEKKRIAKAMFKSGLYQSGIKIRRDFPKMFKFVEVVFAGEELNHIKGFFARFLSELLKSRGYWESEGKFNESNFQQIIAWCMGNDETAILEFKKRVSCDAIFDRVFHQINKLYIELWGRWNWNVLIESLLNHLNMYLKWYLTSDDEVKIYKLSKLSRLSGYSKQLIIFRPVSKQEDKQCLGILLKWFFNDDDAKIQKFRLENFKF